MANTRTPFQERLDICFRRSGPDGQLYKTEQEFADALGASRPSVNMWLNGKRVPNLQALAQIVSKLDVSADWLIGIADESEYSADDTVKLASKYTGLSQKSVETLHQLLTLGAKNELLAVNFLLERILFYRDVLNPISTAITCAETASKQGDALEKLSAEETALIGKLIDRAYLPLSPFMVTQYESDSSGKALATFLQHEFEKVFDVYPKSLADYDQKKEAEYLSSLHGLKEFIEHENT